MNQGADVIINKSFPSWIAAKIMSLHEDQPAKPINILSLPPQVIYILQNLRYTRLTSATTQQYPQEYVDYSWYLFTVMSIWYPLLKHWPPLRI